MIKEIPQKVNHIIKGFKEIKPCTDNLPILYEPIYERVMPLNNVYWDHSRDERIYLTSDTQGITGEGLIVEVETRRLGHLHTADRELFFELLALNGYKIKDGKLAFHPNYGDVYMTEKGIIVIFLSDGCHACDNTIVDVTLTRRADEFEIEYFFTCLEGNGFIYNPTNKSIVESERYYYFPSYSLYNGFQPEKKKWINSDADKFYKKHSEDFVDFNHCANFCNYLNQKLLRDYPEIKLESNISLSSNVKGGDVPNFVG